MKKTGLFVLTLSLLFVVSNDIQAQFGIVQDTVSGTNSAKLYERPGERHSLDILPNASVIYLQPSDEDYTPFRCIEYGAFDRKNPKLAFLLENQVMDIRDLDLIETERFSAHGYISFRNDSIRVVFTLKDVLKGDKRIEQDARGSYVVNNKKAVGIYKKYPEKYLHSIVVTTNKTKTITVPSAMLENFFDIEMANVGVFVDSQTGTIFVLAVENEKNIAYEAVWKIERSGKCSVYWK